VAAAQGHFVHVYVNKATRRPESLNLALRACLMSIFVEPI
jgi:acyl-CoA thioester hydrolase